MAERGSRFWGNVLDAFIPGDAYNNVTGRWNPATLKVGLMGMGVGQVVPGGGYLTQVGASRGWFGQGLSDQLRNEAIYNAISQQYGQTRQQARDYLRNNNPLDTSIRPMGLMGNVGRSTLNLNDPYAFTQTGTTRLDQRMTEEQARIQAQIDAAYAEHTGQGAPAAHPQVQAPWLASPLGPSSGMDWNFGQNAPANTAPSVASQATGGRSQGGGIGYGWTGIEGDAARGFFGGMRDASNAALAQAEYNQFVKSQKQ